MKFFLFLSMSINILEENEDFHLRSFRLHWKAEIVILWAANEFKRVANERVDYVGNAEVTASSNTF